MRLSAATAALVTATVITLAGAGAGTALASPLPTGTSSTGTSSSSIPATLDPSTAAVSEPGDLMLSSSSVRPGGSVSFSGSFAEPAAQTASGITVTSAAFSGPATLDRTDPEAFSGSGTVASGTTPGTYTVTASSSAGRVSAKLTVTGATPVPPHHGGHSSHGSTAGTTGGSSDGGATITDATDTAIATLVPADTGSVLPWALGGVGVIALGGGAYALGRGRAADRSREAAMRDAHWRAAGSRDDDARTEVMHRR
jgi:hypothetical protein